MQFGVLGPLQVVAGDSDDPHAVAAPRLRALLAVLLWRANQPVPLDELAEMVWDGAPPGAARETVRALIMRLRRQLGDQDLRRAPCHPPALADRHDGRTAAGRPAPTGRASGRRPRGPGQLPGQL